MRIGKSLVKTLLATTCFAAVSSAWVQTGQAAAAAAAVPTVADAIAGVVTGPKGPEAGVWVIAETHELPTRLIKIVVTDDQGRYLLPELPKAKYQVWVRGYGLVDSKQVEGTPGKNLNLTATPAPDAKTAAKIYPANYWFALAKPPAESEFPGTGAKGNGIALTMKTQQQWVQHMKHGCIQCHQQGDVNTRVLLDNTPEGWAERLTKARPEGDHVVGDHGKDFANDMSNRMTLFGRARGLAMWSDWTQRIEKGALPTETPPRPQGVERNLVLTSWDWANGKYVHDNVSTDRHDPTVNANGPIYGIIGMQGYIEILHPVTGKQEEIGYKVNPNKNVELLPSNVVPDAFPHNPMLDRKNRLWITDLGRYGGPKPGSAPPPDKMPYCTDPANPYAKYWPQPGKTTNTAVVYDHAKKTVEGIPMCNGMHHLMVGADKKTMYFSGGDNKVVSWVDMDVWDADKTKPEKAMGWCPMVLDTNSTTPNKVGEVGDVSVTPDRTQWNQAAAGSSMPMGDEGGSNGTTEVAIDPKKDTRITGFLYGVDVDVKTNSMWFAQTDPFPSGIVRFNPGTKPPETCKTEMFTAPKLDEKTYAAYINRGLSIDSKGVVFVYYGSGQLGRFDRTKCKVLSGPSVAKGQHCPEGWSFFDAPGPKFEGVKTGTADFHYLGWVDLHDTLGMGKDVSITAGSNSDSLLAFDDNAKKYNVLRVPYPMGFHTRGLDGRIDDKTKGWKGKGVFATYASQPVWHQEGGEDASGPQLVKFQIRPDPLAY